MAGEVFFPLPMSVKTQKQFIFISLFVGLVYLNIFGGFMERVYKKLFCFIEYLFSSFSVILLMFLVILVFWSVISRYFLNISDIYTQELSQLLFPWIAFIGVGLANKEHISVDYFVEKFSKKIQHYITIGQNIITLIFFIFLLLVGYRFSIMTSNQFSPTLAIRKMWFHFAVPVGSFFMLFTILNNFLDCLVLRKEKAK